MRRSAPKRNPLDEFRLNHMTRLSRLVSGIHDESMGTENAELDSRLNVIDKSRKPLLYIHLIVVIFESKQPHLWDDVLQRSHFHLEHLPNRAQEKQYRFSRLQFGRHLSLTMATSSVFHCSGVLITTLRAYHKIHLLFLILFGESSVHWQSNKR